MFELEVKEEENENFIIKTALIKFNDTIEEIYVKLPISEKEYITDLLDPFVIMSIYKMMKVGGKCYVRGKVSKSLLDNLENFCNCWIVWRPDLYKPIEIIADEEVDDIPKKLNNDAITCFSGGLDACFTVYSHYKKLAGRNNKNIKKAIMIHGADIPLTNKEEFDIAFNSSKKILDDINIPLVAVETNYRKYKHHWEMEYISLFISALTLYSKKYSNGIISSGQSIDFNLMYLFSSNPISDEYLGSNNFKVINYGKVYSRTEKANVVKEWEKALKHIRVCWQGKDKSKNCRVCEKCQRTILNFKVCGEDDVPAINNIIQLDNLILKNKAAISAYKEILDYNRKTNYLDEHIISEIKNLIKKSEDKINISNNNDFINELKLKEKKNNDLSNKLKIKEKQINDLSNKLKIREKKINDIVNKIAWWIPVKKWRDNFRNNILM